MGRDQAPKSLFTRSFEMFWNYDLALFGQFSP